MSGAVMATRVTSATSERLLLWRYKQWAPWLEATVSTIEHPQCYDCSAVDKIDKPFVFFQSIATRSFRDTARCCTLHCTTLRWCNADSWALTFDCSFG